LINNKEYFLKKGGDDYFYRNKNKILSSDINCNSLNTPLHHSRFKRFTKE